MKLFLTIFCYIIDQCLAESPPEWLPPVPDGSGYRYLQPNISQSTETCPPTSRGVGGRIVEDRRVKDTKKTQPIESTSKAHRGSQQRLK